MWDIVPPEARRHLSRLLPRAAAEGMPPVAQPFPFALSDSKDAHTHLARACEIGLARGGLALKVYSSNLYPYGLSLFLSHSLFSPLLCPSLVERIGEVSHAGCSYVIMDPWNLLPPATRASPRRASSRLVLGRRFDLSTFPRAVPLDTYPDERHYRKNARIFLPRRECRREVSLSHLG